MKSPNDPSFTLEECGMQDCTEEELKLHTALAIDPFLRCINAPYWLGKTKEQILQWIKDKEVKAAAWKVTQSFLSNINTEKVNEKP